MQREFVLNDPCVHPNDPRLEYSRRRHLTMHERTILVNGIVQNDDRFNYSKEDRDLLERMPDCELIKTAKETVEAAGDRELYINSETPWTNLLPDEEDEFPPLPIPGMNASFEGVYDSNPYHTPNLFENDKADDDYREEREAELRKTLGLNQSQSFTYPMI